MANDQQGHGQFTYECPDHAFQPLHLSSQPSFAQSTPARVVSPETISPGVFPQQHAPMGPDRNTKVPETHISRSTIAASAGSTPFLLRIMKSKWSMIACLTIGVSAAVSHHFLYTHLNGREAINQQWWLRLGQLISFIANANFILAAVMAHQQVAWRAVGQKGFSIQAVDSLFGATHSLVELFNREAWAKSWFVMFLALYIWFGPLVVILTSAQLFVVSGQMVEETLCPSVRTLNFSNEAKESFQTPKKAEGEVMNGRSLAGYNWTAPGGNLAEGAKDNNNIFEYYNGPSSSLDRIVAGVFSSGQTTQKSNTSFEICGDGWDCSTTIHFIGPGYKCEELAKGVGSKMKEFGNAKAPFNLSTLVPAANYTYLAYTDLGEYMRPQMENVSVGGIPSEKDGPNFPEHLGVFRTEPSIWIGYAAVDDFVKEHAKDKQTDGWYDDYTPTIFACDHWEVNYTVIFNFTTGNQKYDVKERDYKGKIIDTTWKGWNKTSTDGTADGNYADNEDNYVSPRKDYARYRRIAAYHSLGLRLREKLFGNVKVQGSVLADGAITTTNLLDRHESLPVHNFQQEVRRVYEDLLISLLSDPQLLAVAWASDPSKLSGTGIGGDDTKYKCERRRKVNFFNYSWPVLAAVYAVSFVIVLTGVYFGIDAMTSDGTDAQRAMTFSAIAGATKKVSVDHVDRRDTKIRCFPNEERPGERTYEFRAELQG
ncbi:hypothetical protein FHETE_5877 [Fusarium heterosporum]|uniref:Uncharacterized protein n=1 Tax=Fusarium heterosporum TaxID=42747 RepID=A0A8H5WR96_FUSHE|nr:hypothetical protein FHETE_5877 [Fusarium heterosporum]